MFISNAYIFGLSLLSCDSFWLKHPQRQGLASYKSIGAKFFSSLHFFFKGLALSLVPKSDGI